MFKFTAYIERDLKTGQYIGSVPCIPGAYAQYESLDELYEILKAIVELCLDEMDTEEIQNLPQFVGIQQIEINVDNT